MKVLVSNVGSTSLKFKLYEMPEEKVLCEGKVERVGYVDAIYKYKNLLNNVSHNFDSIEIKTYKDGINLFINDMLNNETKVIESINEVEAIGFKTVLSKGYNGVFLLNDDVMKGMKDYLFIAPQHNKAYIQAIDEFNEILPNTPKVGVFETAFHKTIPLKNKMYSIPYDWYEKYGIAKNGYHGASFTYISEEANKPEAFENIIACHLGGSSSICAIKNGKSYDSSFGFSLQTGLPHMARCGDVDPYIVPFLLDQGLSMDEITYGMSKNGGILGLSGVSSDLRDVEIEASKGNERCKLAIDVYVTQILRFIGSFYVELGGLDKIVFTGGVGENSSLIRKMICDSLKHMGLVLDDSLNESLKGRGIISEKFSKVVVEVIPANEELGIARKTFETINN